MFYNSFKEFHFRDEQKEKVDEKPVLKKTNSNMHLRQAEQINQIGSRRSSRSTGSHVKECPAVDTKKQPMVDANIDANMLNEKATNPHCCSDAASRRSSQSRK